MRFASKFDPKRYDFITVDSIVYAYDKFDKILIPRNETYSLLNKVTKKYGGYLHLIKPKEDSIKKYISNRIRKIENSFATKKSYRFVDSSEALLSKIEDKLTLKFVILCIDIIGSTKMSMQLTGEDFNDVIRIFSQEIACVVENFEGYILKNVGDGMVIYFPTPPYWGMDDNALDCGVTMKFVIENAINKVFENHGLPTIGFRIGIDTGNVTVTTVGSDGIKQHKDLIGKTINLTSKIQSVAPPNQIIVGERFFTRIHTSRRMLFHEYKSTNWSYSITEDRRPYPIYELNSVAILR